jgi:hypothetical protein
MYIHYYKGSPTAGGTDGTLVSEETKTTLSAQAAIGATTIIVADAANFYTNLAIKIESETATVQSVDYATNIITLAGALGAQHASGATVINTSAESSPISPLNAVVTGTESEVLTLAARCEAGYQTSGNTTITPSGTTAADWALSLDGVTWGAYGAALTISTVIGTTNTLFYAKCKATTGEKPMNDITVNLDLAAKVVAV